MAAINLHSPIPPQTEKRFMSKVTQLARFFGWRVWHPWTSVHSQGGWPDLFMVRGGVAIAAELKRDVEDLRPDQAEWLTDLGRVPGIKTFCWHPSDWDEIVRELS